MKRHIGWSNCRTVECLNLGKMARDFQEKHFRHGAKSARTYRNKRGQKAFHGTSVLRGTQILSGNKVNKFSPDKLPQIHQVAGILFIIFLALVAIASLSEVFFLYDSCFILFWPRTYPPRFGWKMTRLYKRFCTKCDPLPQSAFIEEVCDSFELLQSFPGETGGTVGI